MQHRFEDTSREEDDRKPNVIEQFLAFLNFSKFSAQDDRDRDFSDEVQEEF